MRSLLVASAGVAIGGVFAHETESIQESPVELCLRLMIEIRFSMPFLDTRRYVRETEKYLGISGGALPATYYRNPVPNTCSRSQTVHPFVTILKAALVYSTPWDRWYDSCGEGLQCISIHALATSIG